MTLAAASARATSLAAPTGGSADGGRREYGGRFVRAKQAGHDIFDVDPEVVQETINDVLNDTN